MSEFVSCELCFASQSGSNGLTQMQYLPNCLHSFCQRCYSELSCDSSGTVICPSCQIVLTETEGGHHHKFSIRDFTGKLDVASNARTVMCGFCEDGASNAAVWGCMDCFTDEGSAGLPFCGACMEIHSKARAFKKHIVVPIAEYTAKLTSQACEPALVKCNRHPGKDLEFCCDDCHHIVCQSCVILDHVGHRVVSLAEGGNNDRAKIRDVCAAVALRVEQVNVERAHASRKLGEVTKGVVMLHRDVDARFQELIGALEMHRSQVHAAIEAKLAHNTLAFQETDENLKTMLMNVRATQASAEESLTLGSDMSIYQSSNYLLSALSPFLYEDLLLPSADVLHIRESEVVEAICHVKTALFEVVDASQLMATAAHPYNHPTQQLQQQQQQGLAEDSHVSPLPDCVDLGYDEERTSHSSQSSHTSADGLGKAYNLTGSMDSMSLPPGIPMPPSAGASPKRDLGLTVNCSNSWASDSSFPSAISSPSFSVGSMTSAEKGWRLGVDIFTPFLLIRNLPPKVQLEEFIPWVRSVAQCNYLTSFDIIVPPPKLKSNSNSSHAYVNFRNTKDAKKARQELQGTSFCNYCLEVDYSLGRPTKTVWVGGLGAAREKDILQHMAMFGKVKKIDYIKHKNQSEPYAFVFFENVEDATRAVKRMSCETEPYLLMGRPLIARFSSSGASTSPNSTGNSNSMMGGNINPMLPSQSYMPQQQQQQQQQVYPSQQQFMHFQQQQQQQQQQHCLMPAMMMGGGGGNSGDYSGGTGGMPVGFRRDRMTAKDIKSIGKSKPPLSPPCFGQNPEHIFDYAIGNSHTGGAPPVPGIMNTSGLMQYGNYSGSGHDDGSYGGQGGSYSEPAYTPFYTNNNNNNGSSMNMMNNLVGGSGAAGSGNSEVDRVVDMILSPEPPHVWEPPEKNLSFTCEICGGAGHLKEKCRVSAPNGLLSTLALAGMSEDVAYGRILLARRYGKLIRTDDETVINEVIRRINTRRMTMTEKEKQRYQRRPLHKRPSVGGYSGGTGEDLLTMEGIMLGSGHQSNGGGGGGGQMFNFGDVPNYQPSGSFDYVGSDSGNYSLEY